MLLGIFPFFVIYLHNKLMEPPSQIILLYNKHILYNLHNLNRKYVTVLDVFCKMCALLNSVVVWEVFRSQSTGIYSVLKSCDESNKGTYPCLYRS